MTIATTILVIIFGIILLAILFYFGLLCYYKIKEKFPLHLNEKIEGNVLKSTLYKQDSKNTLGGFHSNFCRNCGYKLNPKDNFCPDCGGKLK